MGVLEMVRDPRITLRGFALDDLAGFTRTGAFDADDSPDYRVLYVGRDDVHGALAYLLAHTSRSLRLNMFGYDDEELDKVITDLIENEHVFVQGTLDRSQAGGAHERRILAGWSEEVRSSFAVGQSATHQISHTKGGVIDGLVAWEGSTNWSSSGEGAGIGLHGAESAKGYRAQNNTLTVHVNHAEVRRFQDELDEEHAVALQQQVARERKEG